ncbi:MAG: aldehyde dehydrogenase family protein, partial [Pedobacter sp.]|nr:aldehyde dehydrogenase family protein [Pedobacter sp.]
MLKSINPYSSKQVFEIQELHKSEIEEAIKKADERYHIWREVPIAEKRKLMKAAAAELRKHSKEYAVTITEEMGKPITQSLAEVEKCALVCEFYAENAEAQLANKIIKTEAFESYVSYEPIGTVLAVMPWNYPFWQVFRFAAPALMAGNVGVLKHASNVMQCAENIEKVFKRAGFAEGCFTNLPIKNEQ